ncbi:MAG: hypothetical protein ACLFVU_15295 [Phycisphaerae bacterium]
MAEQAVANLANLIKASDAVSKRFEAFQAGGGDWVSKKDASFENIQVTPVDGGLKLEASDPGIPDDEIFGNIEDFPRGTYIEGTNQVMGLPKNWKGYDRLVATIVNGDKPVTTEVVILGARSRLFEQQTLEPGQEATFDIDLIDLPICQGKLPPHEPTGVRVTMHWRDGDGPRSMTVKEIKLVPSQSDQQRPCVDRWGQRINSTWPGKVTDDADLRTNLREEDRTLEQIEPPTDRGKFGGWTGGPEFEATGFFYVTQDADGRWWYADPEGLPFWSVGSTGVRYTDDTEYESRRFMFEDLPDPDQTWDEVYTGNGTIRFYCLNILRKYGSLEGWRDRMIRRWKKFGYNTIANWSSEIMMDQKEIPHVRTLATKGPADCKCHGSHYDVFDDRWAEFFEEECRTQAAPQKDNPWVIGYFVDNEKGWRNLPLLNAGSDCEIRNVWLQIARDRFASVEELNASFGTEFSNWDDVKQMTDEDLPCEGLALELRHQLEDLYVETYFRRIRNILKKHDPNHLYMGCRYVQNLPRDEIVQIAGKYCDVLSVNCYSLIPDREKFQRWHDLSGRPIQMGEHQLAQYGPRQLPPLWPSFNAEERRKFYPAYDRAFAQMPFSVGSHWFQTTDQAISGRPSNGENQIIGIVDVTDQFHQELVAAVREITANVYEWHSKAE